MALISQGSTENIVLGEGYSPWALNSNDLYPDSTSYLVGIGNSNPDTALHITAANAADFLKLDNGSQSVTLSLAGTGDNLIWRGDTGRAIFTNYLRNPSALSQSGSLLRLQGDGGLLGFYFDDWTEATETASTSGAMLFDQNNERMLLYGQDGYAGGVFTLDYVNTNNNRFAFGYGNEALSNSARLAIKHTSDAQLLLDNGTNNWTMTAGSSFELKRDGSAAAAFGENGTFGWEGTITTAMGTVRTADYTATDADWIIPVDSSSASGDITVTLPTATSSRHYHIVDIGFSASTASKNIIVAVQTGERMDDTVNGTATINSDGGTVHVFSYNKGGGNLGYKIF